MLFQLFFAERKVTKELSARLRLRPASTQRGERILASFAKTSQSAPLKEKFFNAYFG